MAAMRSRHETGKTETEIEEEFEQKKQDLQANLQDQLSNTVKTFIETSTQDVVETVEKKIKEREKTGIEDSVRDHLRGFSRTIPSFLMAYGNDTVTLATFDAVIPNPEFLEVTSITLDQFRFLRDGGKYKDAETGEEKEFAGNLFDPVVFDDSVKEFLRLKKKLADYFDEKSIEDIFDYIPPQKTNQIFTPKTMVKKMVDMLETENPGCFDDPDKTFIDLYMKSCIYITGIVKRLYQSERMKEQFPDPKERLRHIFEKQVYGLAPTEIILRYPISSALMRVWRTSSIISGSLMPCPTQRKGRSKKNWTSCSDKNENSRIKFRFWSSYFSVCDETYTCVCTSKCNTEICKTKCNGGVAFTFANEFCLFFLGKTVDKLTVHRYNNRAALNGL